MCQLFNHLKTIITMNTSKIKVIAIETEGSSYEDYYYWTIVYLNHSTGEIIDDLSLQGRTDISNCFYHDGLLSEEENKHLKEEVDKIRNQAHINKIIQHASEAGYEVIKVHQL